MKSTLLKALWAITATALLAHVAFFLVVYERNIRLHF